jgi:DNA-binding response OmpR family regulator
MGDMPTGVGAPAGAAVAEIRIVAIDADRSFARVFLNRIAKTGWHIRMLDAPPAPERLVSMGADCLVLDLWLAAPDPWTYLEAVVKQAPGLGVVVCTAESTVADRVRGLRLGADYWISKPCHPAEVVARVEAVVRCRPHGVHREQSDSRVAGEVEIRPDLFQAFVGPESLELTCREFELLELLMRSRGTVMQREEIYRSVWGYGMAHGDRSVDVFVRKLRQKLDAASPGWRYIHTHFGIGYRFEPEADEFPYVVPAATERAAPHAQELTFTAG